MKINKILIIILVIVAIGGFVALSSSKDDKLKSAESNNAESIESSAVEIKNYAYTPKQIKIKKGTTVTWTNSDLVPHTVTITDNSKKGPDSALFGKGKTYTYTFNEVGLFDYFCKPHPYMKGSVEVIE